MEVRRKLYPINAISPLRSQIEQQMNKQKPTPTLPFILPLPRLTTSSDSPLLSLMILRTGDY